MEKTMTPPGMKASLRIAALAAVMACGAACAVHAQVRGKFDDADTNHDGHVTLEEFQAYATSRLAAVSGPRAQAFKSLPPDQQAARLQKRFQALDKGNKGYLDRKDWGSS
jgi:Ca2+-binding EF-hand superfamily protein